MSTAPEKQPSTAAAQATSEKTRTEQAMDLARLIARMKFDRECLKCGLDDDLCSCEHPEPFDMESDDAVETVNSLIRTARAIVSNCTSLRGLTDADF
jgi:hypothetical protein